jgi:glutamate synthase (NADH)
MSHYPPPFDVLPDPSIPLVEEFAPQSSIDSFHAVLRDPASWAGAMPANQGLYMNELEKDACGVGFICQIKGKQNHKIVSDARQLLCNMTHRGATGADSRDGDGAGVMTGIPHAFFKREAERDLGSILPEPGEYAVGNVFFKAGDPASLQKHQSIFTKIADDLGLRVLGWRQVPTDGTILGPAASSTEPVIFQPFVVLHSHYGDGTLIQRGRFDEKHFERQLYVLRKRTTHSMFVIFYLCATPELNVSDLPV